MEQARRADEALASLMLGSRPSAASGESSGAGAAAAPRGCGETQLERGAVRDDGFDARTLRIAPLSQVERGQSTEAMEAELAMRARLLRVAPRQSTHHHHQTPADASNALPL